MLIMTLLVDWKFSEPRNGLSYEVFLLICTHMASTSKFSLVARLATPVICINPRWPLPTFKFWDSLNISRTAKDRNLKFGVRIDYDAYY